MSTHLYIIYHAKYPHAKKQPQHTHTLPFGVEKPTHPHPSTRLPLLGRQVHQLIGSHQQGGSCVSATKAGRLHLWLHTEVLPGWTFGRFRVPKVGVPPSWIMLVAFNPEVSDGKFAPENRPFNDPKGNEIVFQPSIFRGENVSFRKGN